MKCHFLSLVSSIDLCASLACTIDEENKSFSFLFSLVSSLLIRKLTIETKDQERGSVSLLFTGRRNHNLVRHRDRLPVQLLLQLHSESTP